MNYQEALEYINNIQTELGSDYSLKEVTELCKRDGSPEKSLRIIHIAGTNGKGSVGNFLCNMLAMSGYNVGRYISPTLFDYRERIQYITSNVYGVKCEYASEEEIADSLTGLKSKCEEMMHDGFKSPTAFEIETVMAFEIMADWKVDVAIVETGMGGRVDATNLVEKPVLSVITSIGMDHMSFLGSTLKTIAREKYGIIKKNVPVVSIEQEPECMEDLKIISNKNNAPLYVVEKSQIHPYEISLEKTSFIYEGEKYSISQGGVFQIENAAVALCAARVLFNKGFRLINVQSVKEALWISRWSGRFEIVSHNPFVIVDGAHNPPAALKLKESLNAYFPGEKFNFIIGMFKDKNYKQVLKIMLPFAKCVYTIDAPGERGLDKDILAESVRTISNGRITKVESKENVRMALNSLDSHNKSDKTIVFGSLSFLHEVYEYFGFKC
ncbi:MAG: bifunctional folylpolyglutamate synthase/dihydrofolate synthase [Lachnospiraceae bacterium]|nr:bifunctional folylpolyglutamate synthase/dihydrofolate synthase [Lachnospiraceae bacterium]